MDVFAFHLAVATSRSLIGRESFFPNKKPPSGREIVFRESFHFVKMRKTFRDVSY